MLSRLLASIGRPAPRAAAPLRVPLDPAKRSVLNVGGGSKRITLPPHYAAWAHLMLDIDPAADPDVLLDARELARLDRGLFDAVYCSHNLEHYYAHDVPKVLAGFAHVLKREGFAEIRVPDVGAVAREIARGREMEDILYTSPAGAVSIRDVLYGFGRAIEKTGTEFYAHKTGFTRRSLADALTGAGFSHRFVLPPLAAFEIRAIAMRVVPDQSLRHILRLDATPDPL
jgi:hypothetical protein